VSERKPCVEGRDPVRQELGLNEHVREDRVIASRTRPVVSRRERPAKPALTREGRPSQDVAGLPGVTQDCVLVSAACTTAVRNKDH
jgi:hypothetical protein